LASGTVLFHCDGGRIEHGIIGAEGQYTIANAPLGPVRITVQSHAAMPAGLPTRGAPAPPAPPGLTGPADHSRTVTVISIPSRYQDPEKSGLFYTIRTGKQTHDIEMLP
jgi:hypothetical protein